MTYSGQRFVRAYPGKSRGKLKKQMEFMPEVNEETILQWVKANLATSAWIYLQDNDKTFTGKDDPSRAA